MLNSSATNKHPQYWQVSLFEWNIRSFQANLTRKEKERAGIKLSSALWKHISKLAGPFVCWFTPASNSSLYHTLCNLMQQLPAVIWTRDKLFRGAENQLCLIIWQLESWSNEICEGLFLSLCCWEFSMSTSCMDASKFSITPYSLTDTSSVCMCCMTTCLSIFATLAKSTSLYDQKFVTFVSVRPLSRLEKWLKGTNVGIRWDNGRGLQCQSC